MFGRWSFLFMKTGHAPSTYSFLAGQQQPHPFLTSYVFPPATSGYSSRAPLGNHLLGSGMKASKTQGSEIDEPPDYLGTGLPRHQSQSALIISAGLPTQCMHLLHCTSLAIFTGSNSSKELMPSLGEHASPTPNLVQWMADNSVMILALPLGLSLTIIGLT